MNRFSASIDGTTTYNYDQKYDSEILQYTASYWGYQAATTISMDCAREMLTNISSYVNVLNEWQNQATPISDFIPSITATVNPTLTAPSCYSPNTYKADDSVTSDITAIQNHFVPTIVNDN